MALGGPDCLCGGSGRIFDWNPAEGDPCPECTGGQFSTRGQANFKAYKVRNGGCVVVAVLTLASVVSVAALVGELIT